VAIRFFAMRSIALTGRSIKPLDKLEGTSKNFPFALKSSKNSF